MSLIMKMSENMIPLILIAGVIIVAFGSLVFWYGGSLKDSLEIESLQKTINVQTKLITKLQDETDRLSNLGNVQLKTIYYTEELNQNVKAIFLKLNLIESVDFTNLCPLKFGFEFSNPTHSPLSFRKLITDFESKDDNDIKLNSYSVYDISYDDIPSINNHFMDIRKRSKVNDILIQVFVTNKMNGNIRQFHDEKIMVYFPKKLYQKVKSVELIVNGWIILNEDLSNVDWRINKSPWLNIIHDDIELNQAINKKPHIRPPHAEWTINLYDKLPDYNKALSSTVYYGDLVKDLKMLTR